MNDQEDCSGFRIGQVGALGSEMRGPWHLHKGTRPRRTGGRRQTPGTVRRPHRSGQLGLGNRWAAARMASWVHRVPLELPHTLTSAECSGSLGPGPLPVAFCTLRLSGRGALGPFMEEGRGRWEPSSV